MIRSTAIRRVFCAAVWLGAVLVAIKAYYLGAPTSLAPLDGTDYLGSLAAISYLDVMCATALWGATRAVLAAWGARPRAAEAVSLLFVGLASLAVIYAVASVILFGIFGGFLTYPLLALVGDLRMLSSSVAAHLTWAALLSLIGIPLAYAAIVETTVRLVPSTPARVQGAIALLSLGAWLMLGFHGFSTVWATRQDRRIAESPHWVLVSSWWAVATGGDTVRLNDRFSPGDLRDFEPPPIRAVPALRRPPNVIVIVLESVAARWTSLGGGPYDSTPTLKAESVRAVVAESFYAHIGRSSNSLAAILLSTYPKLAFEEVTAEYPRLPGTSLAMLFRDRGYRTAFITPSDLAWADWDAFLEGRGFDELRDMHQLACSEPISSWGLEDRCMVDDLIAFIGRAPDRPFFVMGWTTQTHHPYEPSPGVQLVEMKHEPVPDQWELDRYLNVLRETDRHLGRLFDTLRRLRLERDTIVVVVGDHGQAFGYPHDTYIQGRTMYEEDVHVPLMIWYPRAYRTAVRSKAVGSHVDLAPTIAELAGVVPATDWQGRSLFDAARPQRAYFYVAEDQFTLGLREGAWKYFVNLREGADELYNLDEDPHEQRNLADAEPELTTRMRQRLAAWTEANRRQYERIDHRLRRVAHEAAHAAP